MLHPKDFPQQKKICKENILSTNYNHKARKKIKIIIIISVCQALVKESHIRVLIFFKGQWIQMITIILIIAIIFII